MERRGRAKGLRPAPSPPRRLSVMGPVRARACSSCEPWHANDSPQRFGRGNPVLSGHNLKQRVRQKWRPRSAQLHRDVLIRSCNFQQQIPWGCEAPPSQLMRSSQVIERALISCRHSMPVPSSLRTPPVQIVRHWSCCDRQVPPSSCWSPPRQREGRLLQRPTPQVPRCSYRRRRRACCGTA